MTTWTHDGKPPSEVVQINQAAGDHPVHVHETYAVIARAVDVSKRSGGVFDITVGAFAGLWKFDEEMDGTILERAEVSARLALIGWKDIALDPRSTPCSWSAWAWRSRSADRGYAVDQCVKILVKEGFVDFMVQPAGTCTCQGSGRAAVARRDPRSARARAARASRSRRSATTRSRRAATTSAAVKDGVRYHHILDPRTGFPATASRSVTIRATDAFTADAVVEGDVHLRLKRRHRHHQAREARGLRCGVGRRQERRAHDRRHPRRARRPEAADARPVALGTVSNMSSSDVLQRQARLRNRHV